MLILLIILLAIVVLVAAASRHSPAVVNPYERQEQAYEKETDGNNLAAFKISMSSPEPVSVKTKKVYNVPELAYDPKARIDELTFDLIYQDYHGILSHRRNGLSLSHRC